MTPLQASKKTKEGKVYSSLQNMRRKLNPKFKLGQLVPTADIKRASAREIVQITAINYILSQKLYITPFLAKELIF